MDMNKKIKKVVGDVLSEVALAKSVVVEGVQYDKTNDVFTFDFLNDEENDIIHLRSTGLYKSDIYNNCYYFKYKFEDSVDSSLRAKFIEYVKFHENMDEGDVSIFIIKAVNSLDSAVNLRSFDTIIYPQSISEINRKAISYVRLFGRPDFLPFELVKVPPSEIRFDYESYEREVLDATHRIGDRELPRYTEKQKEDARKKISEMMDQVKGLDYFSIGRDMKYKYRKYLKNIFKFKSEEEKNAYKKLLKPRVLVIDDIKTSGATINYILETIFKVNPDATVVVFTLIGK